MFASDTFLAQFKIICFNFFVRIVFQALNFATALAAISQVPHNCSKGQCNSLNGLGDSCSPECIGFSYCLLGWVLGLVRVFLKLELISCNLAFVLCIMIITSM